MAVSPGLVTVEFDVPARMRDGVILRADVYRPAGRDAAPTLLTRTPYGKATPSELGWSALDPVRAARTGFMVVIQDTRGRFASDGVWDPFRYEQADGYDSVEWAARSPGPAAGSACSAGATTATPSCWPRSARRHRWPRFLRP